MIHRVSIVVPSEEKWDRVVAARHSVGAAIRWRTVYENCNGGGGPVSNGRGRSVFVSLRYKLAS
jgi:hypothetical protein